MGKVTDYTVKVIQLDEKDRNHSKWRDIIEKFKRDTVDVYIFGFVPGSYRSLKSCGCSCYNSTKKYRMEGVYMQWIHGLPCLVRTPEHIYR